jgi:hypothetical protein
LTTEPAADAPATLITGGAGVGRQPPDGYWSKGIVSPSPAAL